MNFKVGDKVVTVNRQIGIIVETCPLSKEYLIKLKEISDFNYYYNEG